MTRPTPAEIEQARTPKGGWTRETLESKTRGPGMTCSTRIAIYLATSTGKIIGTGLVILGLALGVEGYFCWRMARDEGLGR